MKQTYKVLYFIIILTIIFTISCHPKIIRKKLKTKDISLARILVKKELVIGTEDNFPPFVSRNLHTSELVGYDIDMAKAICKKLKLKPVFKIIDWSKKEYLLKTNQIDCIINGFSYSPNREKAFTLSKPYIRTATIFAVLDKSPYKTIKDLEDKKIGIQSSSSVIKSIQDINKKYINLSNPVFFLSNKKALQALEKGEIDAVANDILVINNLITTENKPYRIIPQAIDSDKYVIAFKKNDIALKNKVEEALLILSNDDTLDKISKKWFGANITIFGR